MSNNKTTTNEVQDVPQKIFEKFIEELNKIDISNDVIDRLKKVVLSENPSSEQSIKDALFSDTQNL